MGSTLKLFHSYDVGYDYGVFFLINVDSASDTRMNRANWGLKQVRSFEYGNDRILMDVYSW